MTSLRNETGKIVNFVVSFSHIITDFDFDRSLFERYHKNLTMLEEQYRMHPSICKFSSSIFYKKKLITGTVGPFKSPLKWPKTFRDEQEFERMKQINNGYDRKDFETFRIVFLDVKGKKCHNQNIFYSTYKTYILRLD